jgi:glutathione synthase/RimK-type ligase-like ATP-grasp enzyme
VILLVSNTQDITCDFVVRALQRRRREFIRLNTDEFPRYASGAVTAGLGATERAEIRWKNRDKILRFNEVTSVLYRRPVAPVPDDAIQDAALRKFCADECYDFIRGLLYSLDCHWISHPDAIRRAEHKVYQMNVAKRVGLVMPQTLVSNDPGDVLEFYESCAGRVVVKCTYMGFIDSLESPALIYTSRVKREDLTDLESVRFATSIFQQYIDKDFDLRVTVVGDRVFAAKIEADLPPDIPDWRACDLKSLRHSTFALPSSVENLCLTLVNALGLDFGAIDFVVDREGNFFFLEINPNGQWAWLEIALGLPISTAIVDRLEERAA